MSLLQCIGGLRGVAPLLVEKSQVYVGRSALGTNLQRLLIAFGGAVMISSAVPRNAQV